MRGSENGNSWYIIISILSFVVLTTASPSPEDPNLGEISSAIVKEAKILNKISPSCICLKTDFINLFYKEQNLENFEKNFLIKGYYGVLGLK
jgi:hypothetical protein